MITKENLAKHELIGLGVRVVSGGPGPANAPGISGRVVDETMNTIVVETPKGDRVVPKGRAVFEFALDAGPVAIEGERLLFRPEDRTKKAR